MAVYYEYLISSLPMLIFATKAPFSFDYFLSMCEDKIPQRQLLLLKKIAETEVFLQSVGQKTLDRWINFEIALRNELVKARSARKKIEPQKFLRPESELEFGLHHIAMHAVRMPSLIEAEKYLDSQRWNKLDELVQGHFFDFDFLVVYALKLKILLRWQEIEEVKKEELFKETIVAIG
ncbi:MAG: DUF2764 domain-containing protein [Candidatus Omnitrophica bacterium]|nr:DUF2764 domain-containing protein [Candidatus Omnitrophota bacterium]